MGKKHFEVKTTKINTSQSERGIMEQALLDWISRDAAGYGYLLDFYRRGARICYIGDDGLVLKNDGINICYAAGTVTDVPEMRNSMLTLAADQSVAETLMAKGYRRELMVCRQAIYLKPKPPQIHREGISIWPLTMADLDFVLEHYGNPGAYESHIRGRIAEGMLGGVIDGHLAGFAGVHQEGTMGLLEVLPIFRRRGVAEVLESAVIARQLAQGRLPYCHVREGNAASEALQEKLGLTFHPRLVYWLG